MAVKKKQAPRGQRLVMEIDGAPQYESRYAPPAPTTRNTDPRKTTPKDDTGYISPYRARLLKRAAAPHAGSADTLARGIQRSNNPLTMDEVMLHRGRMVDIIQGLRADSTKNADRSNAQRELNAIRRKRGK